MTYPGRAPAALASSASPKARVSLRAQLYVDGQLIAHNEFLFTTPIADLVRPPEHRNVYQQIGKG